MRRWLADQARAAAVELVALGRRRGWLEGLAAKGPARAEALAGALGADRALVTDWLDGLVLARIVDHDASRGTYTITPEWAEALRQPDERTTIQREAERLFPGHARLLLDLEADVEAQMSAASRALPPGATLVVVELAAGGRVSDNLDHPLGAALYLHSLARRERGLGGLVGAERLRRAAIDAGLEEVRLARASVAGIERAFVGGVVRARASRADP